MTANICSLSFPHVLESIISPCHNYSMNQDYYHMIISSEQYFINKCPSDTVLYFESEVKLLVTVLSDSLQPHKL